ncbi:hypothetical protein D3C85_967610 [compost metagenome]
MIGDAAMQLRAFTKINRSLVADRVGGFALAIADTAAAVNDLLGLCGGFGIEPVGTVDPQYQCTLEV